jgi:uncharacterized protein (TIGR02996 family)
MKRCATCAQDNEDYATACSGCFRFLDGRPTPAQCPACKTEWPAAMAFCGSCGIDADRAWTYPPPAPPEPATPPPPIVQIVDPFASTPPSQPMQVPPNNLPIGNPPIPQPRLRSTPVRCQRCHTQEPIEGWFCKRCGASLPVMVPLRPPGGPRSCLVCARFVTDDQVICGAGCGGALPPLPLPWRATLSTDPVEHELLAAIRATPSDANARMVYTDWLEQRGCPIEATYVRITGIKPFAPGDQDWRAITSRAEISGCDRDRCPGRWDLLDADPDNERTRSCRACLRTVTYCPEPFGSPDPIVLDVMYLPLPGPPPGPFPPPNNTSGDS